MTLDKPQYLYPEYMSYRCMVNRCNDSKRYYGRLNIKVCERWRKEFANFYEDMGDKPTQQHTLDRIDNKKGYFKGNCRWATKSEQMLNRKIQKNNTSGYRGVAPRRDKWEANITFERKTEYLGTFKTSKQAALAYNERAVELHGVYAKINKVE